MVKVITCSHCHQPFTAQDEEDTECLACLIALEEDETDELPTA